MIAFNKVFFLRRGFTYVNIFAAREIHKQIQKHVNNHFAELGGFESFGELQKYVSIRKSGCNVDLIKSILKDLEQNDLPASESSELRKNLSKEIMKLPNRTHPSILSYGETPKIIKTFNDKPEFQFQPREFSELAKKLNILRSDHLRNFTDHKSYYFMNDLAILERALVQLTVKELLKHNFKLMTVPDVLPPEIIEGCGMNVYGERNQVYKISNSNLCLSGTSEMALAGYFSNKILSEDELPIKLAAVSRCFRAETSGLQEEKGLYRVHQFTKVEMFSVCASNQSDEILEHFCDIEIDLYNKFGLHFKLLDMPASELGLPAYRKYDIEAWMPGRKIWGEISSCSNCTDYQAKRLGISYKTKNGIKNVHTVNGTACAIPRIAIALLETNQNQNGNIDIPNILREYFNGQSIIFKQKKLPEVKFVKKIQKIVC